MSENMKPRKTPLEVFMARLDSDLDELKNGSWKTDFLSAPPERRQEIGEEADKRIASVRAGLELATIWTHVEREIQQTHPHWNEREGFFYAAATKIEDDQTKKVKVGYSREPWNRIHGESLSNDEIRVICITRGGSKLEALVKRLFGRYATQRWAYGGTATEHFHYNGEIHSFLEWVTDLTGGQWQPTPGFMPA